MTLFLERRLLVVDGVTLMSGAINHKAMFNFAAEHFDSLDRHVVPFKTARILYPDLEATSSLVVVSSFPSS